MFPSEEVSEEIWELIRVGHLWTTGNLQSSNASGGCWILCIDQHLIIKMVVINYNLQSDPILAAEKPVKNHKWGGL